jgi:hypothetical protein
MGDKDHNMIFRENSTLEHHVMRGNDPQLKVRINSPEPSPTYRQHSLAYDAIRSNFS